MGIDLMVFVMDCDVLFFLRLQHAGNTRKYCNTPLQAAAAIPLETAAYFFLN